MQKARQRKRLKLVDKVVDTVSMALQNNGGMTAKAVDRWYQEMPREEEMLPKDKYTIFDRKEKRYRKGIHSTTLRYHFFDYLANVDFQSFQSGQESVNDSIHLASSQDWSGIICMDGLLRFRKPASFSGGSRWFSFTRQLWSSHFAFDCTNSSGLRIII